LKSAFIAQQYTKNWQIFFHQFFTLKNIKFSQSAVERGKYCASEMYFMTASFGIHFDNELSSINHTLSRKRNFSHDYDFSTQSGERDSQVAVLDIYVEKRSGVSIET
jgi:hypothetical protein